MNTTSGECGDVFDSGVFDYWVISHTLLPFFIFWTGILKPTSVLLLVYLWETIELGFRHCSGGSSNWSEEEPISNSLVVDPVVAICAIVVQVLLRFRFDKEVVPVTKNTLIQIIVLLLSCAPTFWFFDFFHERNLHYMFLVSAIGILQITRIHNDLGWYDIFSILFVLGIFFSVDFATETNSFLVAILVSSIFICVLVISIGLKKRSFSGIENFF